MDGGRVAVRLTSNQHLPSLHLHQTPHRVGSIAAEELIQLILCMSELLKGLYLPLRIRLLHSSGREAVKKFKDTDHNSSR